ncbi:single-stranded DNA-binding protein [Mycoplasma feriruminatoris]|uniref:Single-stranded DNA-binding protein n=1 Tax=Mycoplasma feriruminatoris TaxID=1179777 RepID=A0AAX3TGE2_9MOLU|nr:single-stranded DNA-binding protein [Mycoplasma feriruminatoris]WFQ93043.1 Single-stranded DNA-binding protein [Mycoplasma feriruminatoris]
MNQVNLIGRLVSEEFYERDYEKPNKKNGKLLKFKIATLRTPRTEFLEITVFDNVAEFIKNFGHKGELLEITGSLQNNVYKNKEDKTISKLEVVGKTVGFLTNKAKKEEEKSYEELEAEYQKDLTEFERDVLLTLVEDDEEWNDMTISNM